MTFKQHQLKKNRR